jgi:hypothetical protein
MTNSAFVPLRRLTAAAIPPKPAPMIATRTFLGLRLAGMVIAVIRGQRAT